MSTIPRLVVIESPFAGDVEANVAYARRCLRDSLDRGENPIASHLLYTQPGVLDDSIPGERERGIHAGFAWGARADLIAFYLDRGWSPGMSAALSHWRAAGVALVARYLTPTRELALEELRQGMLLRCGGDPDLERVSAPDELRERVARDLEGRRGA